MKINKDDVVLVTCYGEGHYSGNSETQGYWVTKDFYEEHKETIDNYTPYFHELDGKHSEVQGKVIVYNGITLESLAEFEDIDDGYMVYESMLYDILNDDEDLECELELLNNTIIELFKVNRTVEYVFDGEVITK